MQDLDMQNAFYDVSSAVRLYSFVKNDASEREVIRMMTAWKRKLEHASHAFVDEFKEFNQSELIRVKDVLVSNTKFRSVHDLVFVNALGFTSARPPIGITTLFDKFTRGVTQFSWHGASPKEPIYHRLFSCGTGTTAFRDAFQRCKRGMPKDRRKDVKARIERCYIERMIYDDMYRTLGLFFPATGVQNGNEQDAGHTFRMQETHDDFKSCFGSLSVRINITYDDWIPIKIEIYRTVPGSHESVETYEKTVTISPYGGKSYEAFVDCTRETFSSVDGGGGRTPNGVWVKRQRYDDERKWTRVRP